MAKKRTICFVDDDVKERERFERTFGKRFNVVTAERADECVEELDRRRLSCDLWVLDLYFSEPGVINTADQRQQMNERFATLAAAGRQFNAYLKTLGQGPEGGLAVLQRAQYLTPGVPAMFLTRKGTLADSVRCHDAGAVDVAAKPMPSGTDASPEALDRAMQASARDLAERFQRAIAKGRRREIGVAGLIGALVGGLAIGLVLGAVCWA